jgi:hypothetical protein
LHIFRKWSSYVAVFCDISKAFDRLWHKGLIEKFKSYGINGKLLQWFKEYISERKQQVLLNNSMISILGTLKAGVRRVQFWARYYFCFL